MRPLNATVYGEAFAWVAPVGYLIAAKVGAALELVDGPAPGGGQVEAWFYEETEAGRTLMAARGALRDQEAPFPFWFYMAPAHR